MLREQEQQGTFQYSSKNRGKLLRFGTVAMILGVASTVGSIKQLVYDLPAQDMQISEEIKTRYNAPSESVVKGAKERLMSDRCDDHPCTDKERSTASVIVQRDQLIRNVIMESTSDATSDRKNGYIASAIGIFAFGVGGAAVVFGRRRRT